jgi:hypothetical protein
MRPIVLAVLLLLLAGPLFAQSIPGRDLLFSPLGLTGEAAAFGRGPAAGLWNPATGQLPAAARYRLALAALNAPVDLAFTGQVLSAALRVPHVGVVTGSVIRAGVADLTRTDTDPQSIGGDIPFGIWVTSLGASRAVHEHVTVGAALRWMAGRVDNVRDARFATDVGVLVERLPFRDLRVAASTFLLAPGGSDEATFTGAADLRVAAQDSVAEVRAGLGLVHTARANTELYPNVAARFGRVDLRGGAVRVAAYGATTWRGRLAIALHQDDFTIGVAREGNAAGLTPTYQLSVTTERR